MGGGGLPEKQLSSDNTNDCVQICFNYLELSRLVDAVDTRIEHLGGFSHEDEALAEVSELKVIASALEDFLDLFE